MIGVLAGIVGVVVMMLVMATSQPRGRHAR